MSTRKITVFSTAGKSGKVIETSALNWGALKSELSAQGVSASGMKAVIGKTKTNLEHQDAVLPGEDFNLFLFPEKTRSGLSASQIEAMPYADLRAELKRLSEASPEAFKAHFSQDKNYTNKSTSDLKALLISYKPTGSKTTKAAPVAQTSIPVPAKGSKTVPVKTSSTPARVERKAVPAEISAATPSIIDSLKTDDDKIDFVVSIIQGLSSVSEYDKENAVIALAGLKASSKVKGKVSQIIDTESLSREAEDIRRGLSGVR
jgi:hypothetical protein